MDDDQKTSDGTLKAGYSEIPLDDPVAPDPAEDAQPKALIPYDPLKRYLAEIRRYPLLSREEEHKLGVDYKEYGNVDAAFRLVTSTSGWS